MHYKPWKETNDPVEVVKAWEPKIQAQYMGRRTWEDLTGLSTLGDLMDSELRYRLPWKLPDLVELVDPESARWLVDEATDIDGFECGYSIAECFRGCSPAITVFTDLDIDLEKMHAAVEKIRACDCDLKGCEKCLPVGTCADCGAELQQVRPGKTQCPNSCEYKEKAKEFLRKIDQAHVNASKSQTMYPGTPGQRPVKADVEKNIEKRLEDLERRVKSLEDKK